MTNDTLAQRLLAEKIECLERSLFEARQAVFREGLRRDQLKAENEILRRALVEVRRICWPSPWESAKSAHMIADEALMGMNTPMHSEADGVRRVLCITEEVPSFVNRTADPVQVSCTTCLKLMAGPTARPTEKSRADYCEKHGIVRFFAGGCPECYHEPQEKGAGAGAPITRPPK